MQTAYTVLILLALVWVSRFFERLLPLPLPLLQILVGALLAWPTLGLHIELNPELFLLLFLPPLLFADGWRMPKRELWELRAPVFLLAVGLVLFTVVGAGYVIHLLIPSIPLSAAFALAALLSPTDAVAVSAIARNRLPSNLMNTLQGEALLNDATGLVTFKFALAATLTGVFSLADASLTFVIVALGGLVVGVVLSAMLGYLRGKMIDHGWLDPVPHVMAMLLLPFAAYIIADRLGVSGILSAVAAGMMQSRMDLLPRQTASRQLNRSLWSFIEFVFNGLIFLLLGLQLPNIIRAVAGGVGELLWLLMLVVMIFLALLGLRYVWVRSSGHCLAWVAHLRGHAAVPLQDRRSTWIMCVAGVRGAVTLAGVLSIPLLLHNGEPFPERDTLIFIAAAVILLSLITACIVLPLLLKDSGQVIQGQALREEVRKAWRRTAEAAIHTLETDEESTPDSEDASHVAGVAEIKARLMAEYRSRMASLDSSEAAAQAETLSRIERNLRVKALRAQRLELYRMRRHNEIGDDALNVILGELDSQESSQDLEARTTL